MSSDATTARRAAGTGHRWLLNPLAIAAHLNRERHLLIELTRRQTVARYRGSLLGVLWSILDPLLIFALYSFVFAVVFEVRWGTVEESRVTYALNLFAGLTVYNLFAETVGAAPGLVLAHRGWVRKAIFPLEALPIARLLSNSIHSTTSVALLLVALVAVEQQLPWTWVLIPLVYVPLALFTLGFTFLFAALGVFVRDLANLVRLLVVSLLFLSPIFYPLSRLPASWQRPLELNPLAHLIAAFRRLALEGDPTAWRPLLLLTPLALAVAVAGFAWFMRSKRAFADVL